MAGSSRYTRAISSEVGEIERRLRVLEKKSLENRRAIFECPRDRRWPYRGDRVGLVRLGRPFRQGASSIGDQSTAFGKDAAHYGNQHSPALPRKPNSVR